MAWKGFPRISWILPSFTQFYDSRKPSCSLHGPEHLLELLRSPAQRCIPRASSLLWLSVIDNPALMPQAAFPVDISASSLEEVTASAISDAAGYALKRGQVVAQDGPTSPKVHVPRPTSVAPVVASKAPAPTALKPAVRAEAITVEDEEAVKGALLDTREGALTWYGFEIIVSTH